MSESNNDAPEFVIPDEFKEAGALKGITSMSDVFKKVVEQESHIGKISREKAIPGATDDDDTWNGFTGKLKAVAETEDFSDLIGDEDTQKLFKDAGIVKRQAKSVIDFVKGKEAKKYSKEEFDIKKAEKFKNNPDGQKKVDAILAKLDQDSINELMDMDNDALIKHMGVFAKIADIVGVDGESRTPPTTGAPAKNANQAVNDSGEIINEEAFDKYLDEMANVKNSPTSHEEKIAIRKKYGYKN